LSGFLTRVGSIGHLKEKKEKKEYQFRVEQRGTAIKINTQK